MKFYITGKFVNEAYLYGEDSFEYVESHEKRGYEKLIIDGRKKPIVYGPTGKQNRLKLNQWLSEESTETN